MPGPRGLSRPRPAQVVLGELLEQSDVPAADVTGSLVEVVGPSLVEVRGSLISGTSTPLVQGLKRLELRGIRFGKKDKPVILSVSTISFQPFIKISFQGLGCGPMIKGETSFSWVSRTSGTVVEPVTRTKVFW